MIKLPYIDKYYRDLIDKDFEELLTKWSIACEHDGPSAEGRITYLMSKIINYTYYCKGFTYAEYCTLIGMIENFKLELHRRLVAEYEDKKCRENGDVFD